MIGQLDCAEFRRQLAGLVDVAGAQDQYADDYRELASDFVLLLAIVFNRSGDILARAGDHLDDIAVAIGCAGVVDAHAAHRAPEVLAVQRLDDHVARADLPGVLASVHAALRANGLHFANYKLGSAEGRDPLGRLTNLPDEAWLEHTYRAAGFAILATQRYRGKGADGVQRDWYALTLRKEAA